MNPHEMYNRICLETARKKIAFLSSMMKEFDPIIQSAEKQNNFDWSHLKKFYNNRKTELSNSLCSLRLFCEFAFKLFVKFNCHDYKLVIKIIRIHYLVLDTYTELDLCGHYCRVYNNLSKHYYDEDVVDSRSILKEVNKLEPNIYMFTNRKFYGLLVVGAVHVGDYDYLKFLLKYGLSYSPEDPSSQVKNQLETLFHDYVALNPLIGNDTPEERETFADSVLQRLITTVKNLNLRRINLIMLAVNISLRKRMGDLLYPDYAKCWQLYALTLPEAVVSMKDVKDLLDVIFLTEEAFKYSILSFFKEVFPATPSLSSPRSLKYLCRCTVRYSIRKVPSLETVLFEIPIPNTVKDYLLNISEDSM